MEPSVGAPGGSARQAADGPWRVHSRVRAEGLYARGPHVRRGNVRVDRRVRCAPPAGPSTGVDSDVGGCDLAPAGDVPTPPLAVTAGIGLQRLQARRPHHAGRSLGLDPSPPGAVHAAALSLGDVAQAGGDLPPAHRMAAPPLAVTAGIGLQRLQARRPHDLFRLAGVLPRSAGARHGSNSPLSKGERGRASLVRRSIRATTDIGAGDRLVTGGSRCPPLHGGLGVSPQVRVRGTGRIVALWKAAHGPIARTPERAGAPGAEARVSKHRHLRPERWPRCCESRRGRRRARLRIPARGTHFRGTRGDAAAC